jgi:hypothetical protein
MLPVHFSDGSLVGTCFTGLVKAPEARNFWGFPVWAVEPDGTPKAPKTFYI